MAIWAGPVEQFSSPWKSLMRLYSYDRFPGGGWSKMALHDWWLVLDASKGALIFLLETSAKA